MDNKAQSSPAATEIHAETTVGAGASNTTPRMDRPYPFVSTLCSICLTMEPMPNPLELGICDYCIGESSTKRSETLYQDGLVALRRDEFKSFEPQNGLIPGSIICAWASYLNYKWKLSDKRQACMPLMNTPLITKEVLQKWKWSIKIWKLDLLASETVLLPLRHREHTVLLVVNLKKQKLHCVDIRLERPVEDWDQIADSMITLYYMLLMEIGDERCNFAFRTFDKEVMSPHWGTPTHTDDGMCLMQMMESFDASSNFLDALLAEDYPLFLRKRLSYCGQIVMSWANRVRDEVLAGFIEEYRRKRAASTSAT